MAIMAITGPVNSGRLLLTTGLAIIGFVILLVFSFAQLVQVQRTLDTDEGENMIWMISQAEKEARRLHEAVLIMALHKAGKAELMFRLDILHSRMALLSDHPQEAYLARIGAGEELTRNIAILAELSPALENASDLRELELPVIEASLIRLADNLGRMANHSMIVDRNEKAAYRDQQRKTMYVVMTAFVGLLFTGALLSWLLVSSTRTALQSERELRRHKGQLEAIIAERTTELREALETERHVKEVYRSFITTVSHQFRTPLAIIDIVAQRLARRPEEFRPADLTEKAKRIRNATQRLTRLVASVTGAVRLDAGELILACKHQDLNCILRATVAYQLELAPGRRIRTDLANKRLDCCCDASLIEQVTLNLLSNAIKYSSEGTVINVHSWWMDNFVFCSIQDQGIGIPKTEQPKVFARFYRGSNTASCTGFGLGLNLSRTIIELHGGKLSFTSTEGKGSVFTFRLPAAETGPSINIHPAVNDVDIQEGYTP